MRLPRRGMYGLQGGRSQVPGRPLRLLQRQMQPGMPHSQENPMNSHSQNPDQNQSQNRHQSIRSPITFVSFTHYILYALIQRNPRPAATLAHLTNSPKFTHYATTRGPS